MQHPVARIAGTMLTTGALAFTLLGRPEASPTGRNATAVFAGGCYWGVEAVFRHVRGVKSAVSGFAVPAAPATEAEPSMATSSYVEAVRVEYDPTKVTYQQLLEIFFLVAHDPTEVDRQGPDIGPQYRSVVFVADSSERRVVQTFIDQLTANRTFPRQIATQLADLRRFREADREQQDYVATHRNDPYVVINDAPKLAELRRRYGDLYKD